MKKLLAPSILSADLASLQQQIRYAEMGGADWIHCDIMDGHFVPNISFGPIIVEAAKHSTRLPLDVHLMIEEPDKYIVDFISAGAAYVTVHQEAVVHLNRTVNFIKDNGAKAGVSINPSTPVETLTEILPFIDLVLVMSVNPGFGGQKFIENSLAKISKLKRTREELGLKYLIEVDGGVGPKNIKKISEAGCDVFVAGTSIFGSDNITAASAELKKIISE